MRADKKKNTKKPPVLRKASSSHSFGFNEPSKGIPFLKTLETLKPHDHLCLIYESKEEWRASVVPFISSGLKRGEKCIYIVDTSTAEEIRRYLCEEGMDASSAENSGQLLILNQTEAYTREGFFDPDRMIALLIEETEKAISEGYPALRGTGEMTWMLRGLPGSEKLMEYEAKLNRDFFPKYPCLAICQYDRWRFDPEIIKGIMMTHPLLVWSGRIYRNFYYVEPEEFLHAKRAEREVDYWLGVLKREGKVLEELRKSEEQLNLAINGSQGGVWDLMFDPEKPETIPDKIILSPRLKGFIGFKEDEFPDSIQAWQSRILPEDLPLLQKSAQDHLTGQADMHECEYRIRHKDGSIRWIHTRSKIFRDQTGHPIRWTGIDWDITEQKRMEAVILESEEKYRIVSDFTYDWEYWLKPDGNLAYVSPSCERITGYGVNEFYANPHLLKSIVHPDDYASYSQHICEVLAPDSEPSDLDFRIITRGGEERWINHHCQAVFNEDGTWLGRRGSNRDITKRKQMEEERNRLFEQIHLSRQRLKELLRRLSELQEAERRKLSRELHDRIGQTLTALSIHLDILRSQLSRKSEMDLVSRIEDSQRLLGETVDHIREVMAELRPPVLDDYGLFAALRWYGEQYSRQNQIHVLIQGEELTTRFPPNVEIALFRIAQEALTNVVKHAKAKRVTLTLETIGKTARLTISDDGVGFDPSAQHPPDQIAKWGLITMRERAEEINGDLHIESAPGKGTKVIIEVPANI